ncbi:hypothetical protein QYE76_069957 [Lolium multiflorum]|uniref:Uncharacterized protein n=1 Tax=Lolium multiflorum TaxID=4521 RepID=A0AAD8SJ93_LOLMU|nr:hypothetical protein QYE76_069957 [Lolium multiflorum]
MKEDTAKRGRRCRETSFAVRQPQPHGTGFFAVRCAQSRTAKASSAELDRAAPKKSERIGHTLSPSPEPPVPLSSSRIAAAVAPSSPRSLDSSGSPETRSRVDRGRLPTLLPWTAARYFEVDTGVGAARVSEGASRIFFEVDTGGVAGVFEGASRIFFADSLTRQGYFEVDTNGDGQKRQTTVAKNILRYLPVLPRIQRLFMTEDTAQQMRWAVEGIRPDSGKMIHPSDGTAWKNFVKKYPLKAGDPRSVAIAISTDGFSCWPVFVIPLNLPPGVCTRSEYMFVSMIIPGPKYPGKNMNVYLEPLIDDLLLGWEDRGIRTYDAANKEHFDMPPPPNKDDYRRVDPSARSVDFYQEEGLPGHFTIDLSAVVDNMVVDDEQEEDAVMEEDNVPPEAEDVLGLQDQSL